MIFDILLAKTKTATGNTLTLTPQEAMEFYNLLKDNHKNKLPEYDVWLNSATFLGRRIRVVETTDI